MTPETMWHWLVKGFGWLVNQLEEMNNAYPGKMTEACLKDFRRYLERSEQVLCAQEGLREQHDAK